MPGFPEKEQIHAETYQRKGVSEMAVHPQEVIRIRDIYVLRCSIGKTVCNEYKWEYIDIYNYKCIEKDRYGCLGTDIYMV